jgi:hypothetical protein
MFKLNYASLVLAISCLSACAVDPAAIGPYPSSYRDIVREAVLHSYYDPHSMRDVSISQPRAGLMDFQQGWIVCVEANARNRLGAYAGMQRTAYLIRKGELAGQADGGGLCDAGLFYPWPDMEGR